MNINTIKNNKEIKKPTKKKYRYLKFFNIGIKRQELLEHLKSYNLNPLTLEAFSKIPRELFVPYNIIEQSYNNNPLPIGLNQTVSQPSLVCMMIDLLEIQPDSNILEIGTGLGYNACIMSVLGSYVVTMDIYKELCQGAKKIIRFLTKEYDSKR